MTAPTVIPALSTSEIVGSVSEGSVGVFCWDGSYDGEESSLLILSTGNIEMIYITIIHDETSKGTIISIRDAGVFWICV
jgi:hypothetical protein